MKRYLLFYFLCSSNFISLAQEIPTSIIDSITYPKNTYKKFIAVDNLGNYYFSNFEVITKTDGNRNWAFANYELGIPYSVSVINPLQILVFYKETNTVILLDRFLNETQRINLNQINPLKTAWWAENTKNQEIWIYDGENNRLEFYNYQQNITLSQTIPFLETPIDLSSNFNNAFVLFDDSINKYNIQGTLLKSLDLNKKAFSKIKATKSYLIGKSKNKFKLYTTNLNLVGSLKILKNDNLGFSLKNEKLYIYDGAKLFIYKLTLPSKLN